MSLWIEGMGATVERGQGVSLWIEGRGVTVDRGQGVSCG